jgi:hypothetical protein
MSISELEFENYLAEAGDLAAGLRTLHETIRSSAPPSSRCSRRA